MPIYEYRCPKCGKFEAYNTVEKRNYMVCPKCGARAEKLISKPYMDIFEEYVDYHIDKEGEPVLIRSKRQKKELLKKNGLVQL